MKYRYALTHETNGHATVLATYRWDWLAMLMRRIRGHMRGQTLEVAQVPLDAQEFINLCEHRDEKIARLRELEDRYGDAHPALVILWKLVAKGDDGDWETLFDAGHKLEAEDAARLEQLLGFDF